MPQTPREIVTRCLKFERPERTPRDLWLLPWAGTRYPDTVQKIEAIFPNDIVRPDYFYPPSPRVQGDPYKIGYFTDEWGCQFRNIQDGVIGEVETPQLSDITDWKLVKPPYDQLPTTLQPARDQIRRYYESTDRFVIANCCPRPWERYQFVRGTENAMIDVMTQEPGVEELLQTIHDFYVKELEFWARMDVDALMFMDDWGAQNQLLIPPRIWRDLFKPLYKDYCDIAHSQGKFIFMHSDGFISEIYEDLVEIGVDALNSQLFCMDMTDLSRRVKGKITFWGEIDRQHVLPSANPQDGRDAVREVAKLLYDPNGGLIAEFEFGAGANPETALAIFDEWQKIDLENQGR